ncbi:MAG TPA: RDD family protein [Methanotrichaceae archaeon]|nr:RDD family protein [Methanotrichaceae archaeon]
MEPEIIVEKKEMALDLAGAGSRLVSYLIDVIILTVVYFALSIIFGLPVEEELMNTEDFTTAFYALYIVVAVITIGYYTYFFGKGQTPGMKLVSIKLIRANGVSPVGYGKGLLRWIGMEISGFVLFLGYIWILIDKKNQGWHDKIAGTYVVKA